MRCLMVVINNQKTHQLSTSILLCFVVEFTFYIFLFSLTVKLVYDFNDSINFKRCTQLSSRKL